MSNLEKVKVNVRPSGMRPNTVAIKFSTTSEVEEELNQVKSLGLGGE
jgi:hypothetical protein